MERQIYDEISKLELMGHVLNKLSDTTPAICLRGDLEDLFKKNGKKMERTRALNHVLKCTVNEGASPKYDYVLVYNSSEKKIRFGDEVITLGEEDAMREDFMNEDLRFSSPHGGETDIVTMMTDTSIITSNTMSIADKSLLTIVGRLVEQGKKVCLVIDRAGEFLPQRNTGAISSMHNRGLLHTLIETIKVKPGSHIILLDQDNSIDAQDNSPINFYPLPVSTQKDIESSLEGRLSPESAITAAKLATRMKVADVVDLLDSHDGDEGRFLADLIQRRAKHIAKESGGNLEYSNVHLTSEQVAFSKEAEEYWDNMAETYLANPGLFTDGIILVGPPGTGKSVVPKYLASKLKLPYIKLSDLGTEGLVGVALQKAKVAFEAIAANKPCVLHIDEIDKVLPKENPLMKSNSEDQLRAYIQDKISDKNFMRGIILVGTSNDADQMDQPMLRSGRFGQRIAMLPPQTTQEKVLHFKAVWNQSEGVRDNGIKLPSDEFLLYALEQTPYYATGADFLSLINECVKGLILKKPKYPNIEDAILALIETFESRFPKHPGFDEQFQKAVNLHNAYPLFGETQDEEESPVSGVRQFIRDLEERDRKLTSLEEALRKRNAELDKTAEEQAAKLSEIQKRETEISKKDAAQKATEKAQAAQLEGIRKKTAALAAKATKQAATEKRQSAQLADIKRRETVIAKNTAQQTATHKAQVARSEELKKAIEDLHTRRGQLDAREFAVKEAALHLAETNRVVLEFEDKDNEERLQKSIAWLKKFKQNAKARREKYGDTEGLRKMEAVVIGITEKLIEAKQRISPYEQLECCLEALHLLNIDLSQLMEIYRCTRVHYEPKIFGGISEWDRNLLLVLEEQMAYSCAEHAGHTEDDNGDYDYDESLIPDALQDELEQLRIRRARKSINLSSIAHTLAKIVNYLITDIDDYEDPVWYRSTNKPFDDYMFFEVLVSDSYLYEDYQRDDDYNYSCHEGEEEIDLPVIPYRYKHSFKSHYDDRDRRWVASDVSVDENPYDEATYRNGVVLIGNQYGGKQYIDEAFTDLYWHWRANQHRITKATKPEMPPLKQPIVFGD